MSLLCRDVRLSTVTADQQRGELIIADSRPVNLTELFEYAHVHFRAEPDQPHSPKRAIPLRRGAAGADQNNVATSDDDDFTDSKSTSMNVEANYDFATGRATDISIPISSTLGEAYCENCYAYATFGVEYTLVQLAFCALRPRASLSVASENVLTVSCALPCDPQSIGFEWYFWPVLQDFSVRAYGEAGASAYLRIVSPDEGSSMAVQLVDDQPITMIPLILGGLPVTVYVGFGLRAEVKVIENTLDFTVFTGMSASASLEVGVVYNSETAKFETIEDSDWSYESTPLSLDGNSEGSFNARLYIIPRIIVSPYGLIDTYMDIKPYIGSRLWTSDEAPPTDQWSIDNFEEWSVPDAPLAPQLSYTTESSIKIQLEAPFNPNGKIVSYEVAYAQEGWLYDDGFVVLSPLGFFRSVGAAVLKTDTALSCQDLTSNTEDIDDGNVVTCSQLCMQMPRCFMFSFDTATRQCCVADQGAGYTAKGSGALYEIFDKRLTQYEIRHGDPVGFEAKTGSTIEMLPFEYTYKIQFRALNEKGWSEWGQVATGFGSVIAFSSMLYDLGELK